MRDDDELRVLGELFQIPCEAIDVRLIERRLDLVQNTEGHGAGLEDREQDGDRREGALAAREQRDLGELLPGGRDDDLDARIERIVAVGIVELHLRLAAAEEFAEDLREVRVDLVEPVVKFLLHLPLELLEHAGEIGNALVQILLLRLHLAVARKQVVVVLLRVLVDGAERGDLPLQGADARGRLRNVEVGIAQLLRALIGEPVCLVDALFHVLETRLGAGDLQLAGMLLLGERHLLREQTALFPGQFGLILRDGALVRFNVRKLPAQAVDRCLFLLRERGALRLRLQFPDARARLGDGSLRVLCPLKKG